MKKILFDFMYSPDSTPTTPEIAMEQPSPLEKLRDFNVAEKSKNLKELAAQGINKIKSFFERINIKNILRSFLKQEASSDTSTMDTSPHVSAENSVEDIQVLPETAVESVENPKVLKTLTSPESALMHSEILDYYRGTNGVQSYLAKKNIPKENMSIAENRILEHLSGRRIQEFKDSVANKLQTTELSKKEFAQFWAWRLKNPPKEKPLLIQTSTGIKISYDQFASDTAIEKFLENHISTLDDDFFEPIQDKTKSVEVSEKTIQDHIKTTADIENDITHAMEDVTSTDSTGSMQETSPEQLAYDIEKQSGGWVNNTMYEKVALIPAGEALYMLGSINAELKPSARKLLGEMRHLIDTTNTTQTFESLTQQILDTKNDNPPSEKTLKALSNIVNKLNKVAVLSEQK